MEELQRTKTSADHVQISLEVQSNHAIVNECEPLLYLLPWVRNRKHTIVVFCGTAPFVSRRISEGRWW